MNIQDLNAQLEKIARDKPDLIFEINESCFDDCLGILKNHEYKSYYINKNEKKLYKIKCFESYFLKNEGTNCYATVSEIDPELNM